MCPGFHVRDAYRAAGGWRALVWGFGGGVVEECVDAGVTGSGSFRVYRLPTAFSLEKSCSVIA